MKPPELVATIKNGHLEFAISRLLQSILAGIGEGKQVRVDIKRWYKKRSTKQNSLSWGHDYPIILSFMAENGEPGYTAEELHDYHKRLFLGFVKSEKFPGLYRVKSSADLDTEEFSVKFRENYVRHWVEKGLYIPDPT